MLNFAETLVESPRVWQGRDRHTPKHARPRDTLRLNYKQVPTRSPPHSANFTQCTVTRDSPMETES